MRRDQIEATLERIRAHVASPARSAWWMHPDRASMRADSSWSQVFAHVAGAHISSAVAVLRGGAL